jgi:hypothetical protein
VFVLLGTLPAAAIIVDGTVDPEYGAPIAVQTVQTGFGDANPPVFLGGSELDAAYVHIDNGRLYLMLTGNHEPNFNKLEVFFDTVPGGENTFSGTPDYDYFDGTVWISSNLQGFTLDAGFNADYHLFSRWGGQDHPPYEVDFVNRQGGTNIMVPGSADVGSNEVGFISTGVIPAGAPGIGPNASGPALTQPLEFAINNNNTGGVIFGSDAADQDAAAAVTTGMEFSVALVDLGITAESGGSFLISAMIDNSNHNYLSNQFLHGLTPPQWNLGGDGMGNCYPGPDCETLGGVDMNDFAGIQYFEVTIPPSCDFTGDGLCNVDDINALGVEVIAGSNDPQFDLNDDGLVNNADRNEWLELAATENGFGEPYQLGDADLNGIADGLDFVEWNANKFSAPGPTTPWSDADWDFNNFVDGGDFTAWNANKFDPITAGAVPEPASLLVMLCGVLAMAVARPRITE